MPKMLVHIILFAAGTALLACHGSRKTTVSTTPSGSIANDKHGYIEQYQDIAVREMVRTGIPASITLAQGILESNYGRSMLATHANNHFGIKCHTDWDGPTMHKDDDRKNECFRKYKNAEASFHDHSEFLTRRSRYKPLFKLSPDDYKGWAKGLKQTGYATNPKYPQLLIRLIERFELYRFDQLGLQQDDGPEVAPGEVFEYNRIRTVRAASGDSPASIANAHGVRLSRLLEYNDLSSDDTLREGEKVYLQPKRNKHFDHDFHFVQPGETMREISQRYGIKLEKLYERNGIISPHQPAEGEKLYLNNRRSEPVKVRSKKDTKPPEKPRPEYYTVQEGDTLYSIAQQFYLTVEELKEQNTLPGDTIRVGQQLKVRPVD